MANYKRVFLGCWVSLDAQDQVCEVSLDSSAAEEVSDPSDQQIDSIFQACKYPIKSAINKLLSCFLSVAIELRYAAEEINHLILLLYSKVAPSLTLYLMLTPRLRVLRQRNVLSQITQEWRHGALHGDVEADHSRIRC
jgi:hypothetical protein